MQEGITVSTRKWLTDIGDIREVRDCFDESEFFSFSLFYEGLLEFE